MTDRKVRKIKKPRAPLAGFKGKVSQITYSHAIKIGIPSRDRFDPNHSMDAQLGLTLVLSDEDDWRETEMELIHHVHNELEKASEERKQYWMKELGVDEE